MTIEESASDFTTCDGVVLKVGDDVSVWVSMSGRHTLQRGVVRKHGVMTWCGDGVGHVRQRGFSTNEAAIAAGCPCTQYGKPCCEVPDESKFLFSQKKV